jgi:hypothetical protein
MTDQPMSPADVDAPREQTARGSAPDPRRPIEINSDNTDDIFLFGRNQLGMLDRSSAGSKDRTLLGGDEPAAINPNAELQITGSKEVKIDLKNAAQMESEAIRISAEEGRDSKLTIITGFTGTPPLRIDDGNVSVQMTGQQAFGFRGSAGKDENNINVTSSITLAKDEDGNTLIQRDGKTIMTVEKDAKLDIRDEKGNVLLSVDGSLKLEENQKNFDKAREKAFKQFQKDIADKDSPSYNPDIAGKTLNYVAQVAAPGTPGAQPAAPEAPNPMLEAARGQFQQLASGAQSTLLSAGKDVLTTAVTGVPRIPGAGGRGPV